MRSTFHNLSAIENVDDVGLLDCAEAVSDSDGGAALGGDVEGGLDDFLGGGVEGRGSFVKEEDLGVADEGAGDGDALLLAAGEECAFSAADGVESFREGDLAVC